MMAENRTMSDHLRWLADTSESDGFSALYDIADRMEDLQEMLKAEKQLHAKTARTMHNAELLTEKDIIIAALEADKAELVEALDAARVVWQSYVSWCKYYNKVSVVGIGALIAKHRP